MDIRLERYIANYQTQARPLCFQVIESDISIQSQRSNGFPCMVKLQGAAQRPDNRVTFQRSISRGKAEEVSMSIFNIAIEIDPLLQTTQAVKVTALSCADTSKRSCS
jgi:hypothetical protein